MSTTDAAMISDEHHTMEELYRYRMLYNAHAAQGWLRAGVPVVKSWNHSDGEPCYGGGWFIVTATLPTGQVSNHYRSEFWDLFAVPEVDLPPAYDGHTPEVAAGRLGQALISLPVETEADRAWAAYRVTFDAYQDRVRAETTVLDTSNHDHAGQEAILAAGKAVNATIPEMLMRRAAYCNARDREASS